MIVDVIEGDLIKLALKGVYDAIVHGCNCMNTMGAGIAKQIRNTFPEAYEIDSQTTKGDKTKLGTYTSADLTHRIKKSREFFVINAYTQYDYKRKRSGNKMNADYNAIKQVFTKINKDFAGKDIGIPKIGAGLAGGNWDEIAAIINSTTPDLRVHLVEFKP